MPDHCSHCDQKFQLETGFFYGAMYVNYALSIAITISLWVGIHVFTEISLPVFLLIDILLLLLLTPVVFRLSRSIWIHFFIKYDKEANLSQAHEGRTH